MSLTEAHDAMQSAALRGRDGVKFNITNRSGSNSKRTQLLIEGFNFSGIRIESKCVTVEDLDDGKTQEIKVTFSSPSDVAKVEVKVVDAGQK